MPDRRTRRLPQRYADYLSERGMDAAVAWGVGNIVAAGAMVVALLEDRVLRAYGLTHAGYRLLTTICINGPSEPRELARLLYLSRPAVVNGLNTLERAKLIVRVPDDADRRLVRAVATDEGRAAFEGFTAELYDVEREITDMFEPAEREALFSLTGQLAHAAHLLVERAAAERPRGPLPRTAARDRDEDAAI